MRTLYVVDVLQLLRHYANRFLWIIFILLSFLPYLIWSNNNFQLTIEPFLFYYDVLPSIDPTSDRWTHYELLLKPWADRGGDLSPLQFWPLHKPRSSTTRSLSKAHINAASPVEPVGRFVTTIIQALLLFAFWLIYKIELNKHSPVSSQLLNCQFLFSSMVVHEVRLKYKLVNEWNFNYIRFGWVVNKANDTTVLLNRET